MLTGDSERPREAVAARLGIDEVQADVLPERKREVVQRLQREGRIVAMAGDGINDAPALAEAAVGIAMGTGTDVAIESAGITLVKGDLRGIVRARRLAARDDAEHPAEPVPGVRLQRRRRAGRRRDPVPAHRNAHQSYVGERGDDLQLGLGDHQRSAATPTRAVARRLIRASVADSANERPGAMGPRPQESAAVSRMHGLTAGAVATRRHDGNRSGVQDAG